MSEEALAPPPPPATVALWPADVLARQLVSDDPQTRTMALGMALQPHAPLENCAEALTQCAQLSLGDALASQMAAAALGGLPKNMAGAAVQDRLADFLPDSNAMPVRIAAAHALFRLGCLPAAAHEALGVLLLDADPNARKVALLALTPFARAAAGAVVRQVAAVEPRQWTLEALQAVVKGASGDSASATKVEGFVMRSLAGVPLVPAGVAGYAALARLNTGGQALTALLRIAGDTENAEASTTALEAIGELGESVRSCAQQVAQLLTTTDDPAREELLCRTLVRLHAAARDIPLARVLLRLKDGPDRSVAAHCMLLCLHPKDFRQAAVAIVQRHGGAGEALQQTLSQTHKTLTGTELSGDAVAGKV
ncbi:MAG: hypothetical protein ABI919_02675 [Ramlibacter sp.]